MSQPDIFLSYNREDAIRAKHFADALQAAGFKVWWDAALRSGEAYDEVTEKALREAKAVVVLWSPRSVVSRWVRAEATLADRNKTLMPVMIEACERPIMFELVQTAELSHWQGDASDAVWKDFVSHVRDRVGAGPSAVSATKTVAAPKRQLPTKPSIAVLPFINLSGDLDQEYFADGVVDDIISALSRFNQLFVIARSSSFTYKGRKVDYRTVADELGVRFVLEGSVRKAGNRLRISGQLVDVQSGAHLWADRYEGALEEVFELQDRITEQVVGAIEPSIQQAEILRARSKPTDSLDAYDLFLQALPLLWSFKPQANAPARKILQKALSIDPHYPQALALMAWAYEQSLWFGARSRLDIDDDWDGENFEQRRQNAVEYCRRGIATGNNDAHVLALCGFISMMTGRDIPTALVAKDRALKLNPNSSWAIHFCGAIESMSGNPRKGLELAERALRLNPLDPHKYLLLNSLGIALQGLERWEEAAAVAESYIPDAPEWMPGLVRGAVAWAHVGDTNRAHMLGSRILALDSEATITSVCSMWPPFLIPSLRKGLALAGIPA